MRRMYRGNTLATTLSGGITSGATSLTVAAGGGSSYPDATLGPFVITLNLSGTTEEKILVGARTGDTFSSLTRGYDGTTAAAHSAGETVRHTISAVDLDEANAHVNASAAVHGLTGSVVGTSDVQTLTNKTLVAPLVNATASTVPLTVQGAASQTADLFDVKNSAGTALARIGGGGQFFLDSTGASPNVIGANAIIDNNARLSVTSGVASVKALVVQGAASQTANLQEWQNSAGTVLFSIASDGLPAFAGTVGSATAGTATLPAAPTGFLTARLTSGTSIRIPYYNV
ncbi:MAG: hypothetical protein NVSMB4_16940 [Acidimicrobiales bacterium]